MLIASSARIDTLVQIFSVNNSLWWIPRGGNFCAKHELSLTFDFPLPYSSDILILLILLVKFFYTSCQIPLIFFFPALSCQYHLLGPVPSLHMSGIVLYPQVTLVFGWWINPRYLPKALQDWPWLPTSMVSALPLFLSLNLQPHY